MTPHKPLLLAAVVVVLCAAVLMVYAMEKPCLRPPTEKHEGAAQKSSAPYAAAARLEKRER
jgi:hypothetical protein